jgi:ribosomal protein S18 acetylase RimI-like enzyme
MPCLSLPPAPDALAARGASLRAAVAADAEFMRDVYVAARWEEMAVTGWPPDLILTFLHDQFRLQTLHYDKHYAEAARLVIECDGAPAGKLLLLDNGTEIRIVDIGFMPACRGRGLGGILVEWTQDIARSLGRTCVSLHVEPNNPAKRLYHRLGFSVIELRGVYELMEWRVGPVAVS